MPIMFNTLLSHAGLDLDDVILVRHKDNRADRGRTPYEMWRDNRPAFEDYQSHQDVKNRSRFSRAGRWASFVGTPGGETMFAGLYTAAYEGLLKRNRREPHRDRVSQLGSVDVYRLKIDKEFSDLSGKLYIDWGKGARAWVQRADRQDKPVIELRPEFKEPEFPGFLNFMKPLSQIVALPRGWTATLKSSRGIYLLTCPKTKEQYVGMAIGAGGFWQRWLDYCRTGHGDNVALRSRDPSDYQVSILEVAGTSATDQDVSDMEVLWKQKLQSREMGLNRN